MPRPVVEVRAPQPGDVEQLVANMRDQDVAEVRAAGRDDLAAVVHESIAMSQLCWTVTVDGELACILGLSVQGTVLAPIGVPWMLGTPLVPANRRPLAKLTPRYIERMLQAAPHLVNFVHARNTVAVHWLKKVGFHLRPATPHGPRGELFHLFEMHHV